MAQVAFCSPRSSEIWGKATDLGVTAFEDAKWVYLALRHANIPVDVQMEEGLVVQGDRAALVQAVGNLLSNAWKYTPTEGRRIAVSAAADLKHVYISVIDNGLGISVSEQELIFDKFQRGAAARERGGPGSGLGLALVRAIVAAHDGSIDVQSKLDHGATFRIVLPRSLPEPA